MVTMSVTVELGGTPCVPDPERSRQHAYDGDTVAVACSALPMASSGPWNLQAEIGTTNGTVELRGQGLA